MKKYRLKRYKEKIDFIGERLSDIEGWIQNSDEKLERLACYKAFQEIIEGIYDIIAMLLKDEGKVVEDDYANLEKVRSIKILNDEEIDILIEANGLRNRIIHRYNTTDDKIAVESMENLIPEIKGITKKFEKSIKNDQSKGIEKIL